MKMIAKTLEGLEVVLSNELRDLGAEDITVVKRAVIYSGPLDILYRSNLELRTALKVLVVVKEFDIKDENDFYDHIFAVKWEDYISVSDTIAVDSVVNSETFRHANFMALKCKDAVVDRFRQKFNERPSVNIQDPSLRINVHIRNNTVTLSLDSSGKSLHMRGYRKEQVHAPLNEVLAAGLILLSEWNADQDLMDGMCGSATILCEAANIARDISPQRKDRTYAVQKWKSFHAELWDELHRKAHLPKKTITCKLVGYDKDERVIEAAKANIKAAELGDYVDVGVEDFFFQEGRENCMLIMNPPYDERLREDDILDFYKFIGDKLKMSFAGSTAWILSGHIDAMKHVGLRPSRRISLLNGSIVSLYARYDLYRGSKKTKFQNHPDKENEHFQSL